MTNRPPPFKGLDIGIPILIPAKGRGFMNQGSGVQSFGGCRAKGSGCRVQG